MPCPHRFYPITGVSADDTPYITTLPGPWADEAAKASTTRSPNGEPMFWAAIREDLIVNSGSLLDLRHWFAEQHGAATARWSLLGGLTDLRLLDVLAWSVARTSSVR